MQIIAPDLGIRNRSETKFLLHPDGADQSTVFFDRAYGSSARSPIPGCGCGYFNGSAYATAPDSEDFTLGTNNFVMEGFVYVSSLSSYGILGHSGSGDGVKAWNFYIGSGKLVFLAYDGSGASSVSCYANTLLTLNAWNYVVAVRSGTAFRIYLNGVLDCSSTVVATPKNPIRPLVIGAIDTGSYSSFLLGLLSELRFSVGTDRGYTGSTIPVPTSRFVADSYTRLLLHFDNLLPSNYTAITDYSASPKTITNSGVIQINGSPITRAGDTKIVTQTASPGDRAVYFDGSGDSLTVPDSPDFNFGVGDFTIHFFAKFASLGASSAVIYMRRYDANNMVQIATTNTNDLYLSLDGGSGNYTYYSIDANFAAGVLYHIAWCRCSGAHFIFINGNRCTATPTASGTPNINMVAVTYIGANYAGTGNFNGYIVEFTIVKGRALWTRNFTPPNRLA